MGKLINLALKLTGIGKVWAALDGYKTYGSAAIGILTGLLGILLDIKPMLLAHDTGALYTYACALPSTRHWEILTLAVMGLGIGHKLDKQTVQIVGEPAK